MTIPILILILFSAGNFLRKNNSKNEELFNNNEFI